ncbi:cytochrome bd-I oxidase subunit CydX [Endosaccharibacter trunci]|uniref:cytochrome bd-I oxidase subunit CydX n=1 Tax=Endosaccharibacter trunci TaxID=2812733 RepID=UPI003BF470A3
MWYFTWVLGLGLAVSFAVLNGMWHEFRLPKEDDTPADRRASGFHDENASPLM